MKTILTFNCKNEHCLPPAFQNDDVRFSDSFAEFFISHFTKPGDTVFDPFAGFGTTLFAAEKLGRRAVGVELIQERAEYIKERLYAQSAIHCGNALNLNELELPMIDFVLTSPPYMPKYGHSEYPLAGYKVTGQGYADYLKDLTRIFKQICGFMANSAYAVIEASNLIIGGRFTPLAWDIAQSVGAVMPFKQELIIQWESDSLPAYGFGYDHSYALVFHKTADK